MDTPIRIADLQADRASPKAETNRCCVNCESGNEMSSNPKIGSDENIITSSCLKDVNHTDSKKWWQEACFTYSFVRRDGESNRAKANLLDFTPETRS